MDTDTDEVELTLDLEPEPEPDPDPPVPDERMAARMVGQDTPWSAGMWMMRADDPVMWGAIVQASRIEQENREVIAGCVKSANGSGQVVRCSVKVPPMRK